MSLRHNKRNLHPVCSLCQSVNDKFFILRFPSPHGSVRVHNKSDIICNVRFLSSLVMKREMTRCQRFKNSSNVLFGSTGNANPQIWVRMDEVFYQIQNLFARGRNTRSSWTFIYSVNDDVRWGLSLDV